MKTYPEGPRTLFALKQESVREAVYEQAAELFVRQGYQATTIDDIARAAAIGRRTFFRYFESKDDVVLWRFDRFARDVVERLGQRPGGEAPLEAISSALLAASEFYTRDPQRTIALLKLTLDTPSLFAQQLLQAERWKLWLADGLRVRTRGRGGKLLPEVVAGVGLELFAIAVRRWIADPTHTLATHVGRAFSTLQKLAL